MADERFQDFNEKTNPDSTDELVGVDDTGYIRVPFSSINPVFTGDGNGDGMVKDPNLGPASTGLEFLSITGDFVNTPISPVGGLSAEFKFNTSLTGDPGTGYFGFDTVGQTDATELRVSNETLEGTQASFWYQAFGFGDVISVNEQKSDNEHVTVSLTGPGVVDGSGLYTTFPVSVIPTLDDGGLDNGKTCDLIYAQNPNSRVPTGGTAGQIIIKDSSAQYDTSWADMPSGGDTLPEYFKFMVGDSILIVQTGQSNPQGLEARRAAAGVDTWENNRVWDWQWSDRTTVLQDYTDFSDSRWGWVNPATTQAVGTNFTFALIYMGYIGGNTGNQIYSLANEVQLSTGRDVYVVNLSQGGADVQWWEAASGTTTDMALVLENALDYILAGSTGVDFGGKPGPDIVTWGQSEANFPAPLGTYPDTPTNWAQRVYAVFELAKSQTNSWIADGYSKIFLTEATDYVNWDGVPGSGSYAGCPYQWDGANILATKYGDDITLVSSRGIEHGDGVDTSMVSSAPASNAGLPTTFVHYSGDGNDAYGRRIASIILGVEREFKDTDLDVLNGEMSDRVTALEQGGGSDLNPVQKAFGVNGDNPQVVTHLMSASEGESVTTDGEVYGNEPIRCHMTSGGSVTENYGIFAPGAAYITTSGANGYTGLELTVYPLVGTTTPKLNFGANVAWFSPNETGTRYLLRAGWHRPMNQSNRDWGIYFEYRYDSDNWWAVVEDSVGRTEQDTGIPAAQWQSLISNMDSLLIEYDQTALTAIFTVTSFDHGISTKTVSVAGFAELNALASVGVYIERTESSDPAQANVDFMYVDATVTGDTFNVAAFV